MQNSIAQEDSSKSEMKENHYSIAPTPVWDTNAHKTRRNSETAAAERLGGQLERSRCVCARVCVCVRACECVAEKGLAAVRRMPCT